MRTFASTLAFVLILANIARAQAPAAVWSVEVSADGNLPAADLERAAGAIRSGLRAAGKVVAPDVKSAEKHLVAHVSANADDFAVRIDAISATESGVAVTGPRVLLEDGAKRAAIRVSTPVGRIAIPIDLRAEWFVDGRRVVPEAGTSLVVPRGSHVVRASGSGFSALATVEVAGGETTPFPRVAIPAAGATVASAPASRPVAREPEPARRARKGPWLWVGIGAAALAAGGVAAAASQSRGASPSGTPVPSGPGTSTLLIDTTP